MRDVRHCRNALAGLRHADKPVADNAGSGSPRHAGKECLGVGRGVACLGRMDVVVGFHCSEFLHGQAAHIRSIDPMSTTSHYASGC